MEGDGQFEALFAEHSFRLAEQRLRCRNGRPVTHLCLNKECGHPSLHCSGGECGQCSQAHEECESVKLAIVTNRLTERQEISQGFMRRMFEIEERMIQEIQNQRRAIVRKFLALDLEEQQREIVRRMYYEGDAECMRG